MDQGRNNFQIEYFYVLCEIIYFIPLLIMGHFGENMELSLFDKTMLEVTPRNIYIQRHLLYSYIKIE